MQALELEKGFLMNLWLRGLTLQVYYIIRTYVLPPGFPCSPNNTLRILLVIATAPVGGNEVKWCTLLVVAAVFAARTSGVCVCFP
jgi:hypothetical protein